MNDLEPAELRVLGCLIEKQRTTPDVYPLSMNAMRSACNQSTNRDPVVDYDEATIRDALQRLCRRGWVRLASGPGSRAVKYRHLFDEALRVDGAEISVLAVLMLRGPQTPGELKLRTERLHAFDSLGGIHETLETLIGRELVVRQERRPGQKEERYAHLLGAHATDAAPAPAPAFTATPTTAPTGGLEARVARLEEQIAELLDALDVGDERSPAPRTGLSSVPRNATSAASCSRERWSGCSSLCPTGAGRARS